GIDPVLGRPSSLGVAVIVVGELVGAVVERGVVVNGLVLVTIASLAEQPAQAHGRHSSVATPVGSIGSTLRPCGCPDARSCTAIAAASRSGCRVPTNQYGCASAGSSSCTSTTRGRYGRTHSQARASAPGPIRSRLPSASSAVAPATHGHSSTPRPTCRPSPVTRTTVPPYTSRPRPIGSIATRPTTTATPGCRKRRAIRNSDAANVTPTSHQDHGTARVSR